MRSLRPESNAGGPALACLSPTRPPVSRIIRAGDTPATRRHAHRRSSAEALRLLATRPALADGYFDAEAKDLVCFLAVHLRGIGETIEGSAQAWDDRNYWKKAEALRDEWRWAPQAAGEIEALVVAERWAEVVPVLVSLIPKFADVSVTTVTRDADLWVGAHRALVRRTAKQGAAKQGTQGASA